MRDNHENISAVIQERTKYRNACRATAEKTLSQVFEMKIPISYQSLKSLKILVIGAGDFPTYKPFLKIMKAKMPDLKSIDFVLVDPDAKALNLFSKHFLNAETREIQQNHSKLKISCKTKPIGLKNFLINNNNQFHIIYYELSPISTLAQLIEPMCRFFGKDPGGASGSAEISDTMPSMAKIFHQDAIIVATTYNFEEQKQMERLMNYSLGINPQPTVKSLLFSPQSLIPKEYSCAVSGVTGKFQRLDESEIRTRSQQIKISRDSLIFFIIVGLLPYILRPQFLAEKPLPYLFNAAQLFMHYPEPKGLAIKIFIVTLEIVCLTDLTSKITSSFGA